MELTIELYKKIEKYLPIQRGNVVISNYDFLQAIFYIVENGCKWRKLPKEYGKWNSIYRRINRWAKNGVLEKVFVELEKELTSILILKHYF